MNWSYEDGAGTVSSSSPTFSGLWLTAEASLDLILLFSKTLKSHSFLFAPVSPFTFHIPCTKNDWITFWQIVDLSCMTHFFHFINLMISEKKWRLKWASYILPRSYQNWWCSCINFDLQATEIHVHSNHFDQCYGD